MPETLSPAELQLLAQTHAQEAGGLLPLLHDIQDRVGYVPPEAVPTIARAFNRFLDLGRVMANGLIG